MARASETYRGARRNAWRASLKLNMPDVWSEFRLQGSNWKRPFDNADIKHRPRLNTSWDWRRGFASERIKAKAAFTLYRSEKGLRISLANLVKRVLYGG